MAVNSFSGLRNRTLSDIFYASDASSLVGRRLTRSYCGTISLLNVHCASLRAVSGLLAVLLLGLTFSPFAPLVRLCPASAIGSSAQTVSVVRASIPVPICLCARCHMKNCSCNPDYWKTHSVFKVVCSCSSGRIPLPAGLIRDRANHIASSPVVRPAGLPMTASAGADFFRPSSDFAASAALAVPSLPPRVLS